MTILYRSPNIIIDAHEWHVAVLQTKNGAILSHQWRPLSAKTYKWQSISAWQGPKPKRLSVDFWPFRTHIRQAMSSEENRAQALREARGVPTGAMLRNPGAAMSGMRTSERCGTRAGALV